MDVTRPLPRPNEDSRQYWEGCQNGTLIIQHCRDCGNWQFYPRKMCSHCLSDAVEWQEASGRGTVYSFTEVHRAPSPAFAAEVPYIVAVVELDEGPRMMTRLQDCEASAVAVGLKVEATFVSLSDEIAAPYFRPSDLEMAGGSA